MGPCTDERLSYVGNVVFRGQLDQSLAKPRHKGGYCFVYLPTCMEDKIDIRKRYMSIDTILDQPSPNSHDMPDTTVPATKIMDVKTHRCGCGKVL
jgi:hypothetical protein